MTLWGHLFEELHGWDVLEDIVERQLGTPIRFRVEDPRGVVHEALLKQITSPALDGNHEEVDRIADASLAMFIKELGVRVMNECLNQQRREKLRALRERESARWHDRDRGSDPPDITQMRMELNSELALAVGQLPIDQRLAIVLRYLEGMKLREVAALLAAPVATIESRIYRALDRLRSMLKGMDKRWPPSKPGGSPSMWA